jgi:A/G-specific adenine glycosylase
LERKVINKIQQFQQTLNSWWQINKRDFPWRHNRSPYRTLIAEVMLRRTRAEQVVSVFENFIHCYPTLSLAAMANPEDIQAILYPLGLNWRIDNIINLLKTIHDRYGEIIPTELEILKTLPGVGDYVAGAVACFAGGQCAPLIDTNVVRVLGRIFGVNIHGEARRRREMRDLANSTLDRNDPVTYHYAILDFAAKICTSKKPSCNVCPFAEEFCFEFNNHPAMSIK